MKHTKGKVEVNIYAYKSLIEISRPKDGLKIADIPYIDGEAEANASLIAEAFNVTNESGLTPRQLMEKVKSLEAIISKYINK